MVGVQSETIMRVGLQFASGMIDNLSDTVTSMFFILATLDMVLSFIFDESDGLNIFMKLFKKILYYSFFLYLIYNFKSLVFKNLFGGFIQLANVATGHGSGVAIDWNLMNSMGVDLADIIAAILSGIGFIALDYAGVESATTIGLGVLAGYVMFFLMLYVYVLSVFIKFYFMAAFSYILMPFAAFEKTKDITLKGLNGLFGQAVEIFVLTVFLRFLEELRGNGVFSYSGSIKDDMFTKWAMVIFMWFLITKSGTVASSLLAGAIATLGIGQQAQANAFGKMTSGGKVLSNDINTQSKNNNMDRFGSQNRNESAIFSYASKIGNRKSASSGSESSGSESSGSESSESES